jgi:hypothetical protein
MHPAALEGFARMLHEALPCLDTDNPMRVLDVGGSDVNGTVHGVISSSMRVDTIDVLDVEPGPGVTIVADATDPATWSLLSTRVDGRPYDLVICTEVLEHVSDPSRIVHGVTGVLRSGGWFIGTCASIGRRPHGVRGADDPASGEWYLNVSPAGLVAELLLGFDGDVIVEYSRRTSRSVTNDLYWRARL